MIYKLLGLVLIAPFLALLLNLKFYTDNKKSGYTMTENELNKNYFYFFLFVFAVEAFGLGLYFLFK
jgi:hypothetical protein